MNYESLESVKALRRPHEAIGRQVEVVLSDAREPQEASQAMIFLLRVLAMSTEVGRGIHVIHCNTHGAT